MDCGETGALLADNVKTGKFRVLRLDVSVGQGRVLW